MKLFSLRKTYSFTRFSHMTYLVWAFSGLLTGISLLIPKVWFFVFIGLGIQLWLLHTKSTTVKEAFWGAFVAGTIHMLLSLLWLWSIVQLDWLGIDSPFVYYTLIAFVWVTVSVVISIGYASAFALVKYIAQDSVVVIALFPFVVLIGELLGRGLYALYTLGVDTSLNISFGVGQMGFALVESSLLLPLASIAGVYSLTLALGLVVSGVYWCSTILQLTSTKKVFLYSIAILLLVLTSRLEVPFRQSVILPENVALITTEIPIASQRIEDTQSIYDAVTSALDAGYTTVVTPEDARFLKNFESPEIALDFLSDRYGEGITVVDTASDALAEKNVLRAYTIDTTINRVYTYDKQYLVPGGEYMPVMLAFFISLIDPEIVSRAGSLFGYQKGVDVTEVVLPANIPPVLFCYESIVPGIVARLTKDIEVPFVAHVVSQAWFTDGYGLLRKQLQAMVRVQAVYANVVIGQSANSTPSAVYTPDGHIYEAEPLASGQVWRVDSLRDLVDR